MAAQSADLAAETAVMRRFDAAMRAAAGLPSVRARGRLFRYAADRIADHLEAVTDEMEQAANGQKPEVPREHT